MTTNDPIQGRLAATPLRVSLFLCACLLGAVAMPASAQQGKQTAAPQAGTVAPPVQAAPFAQPGEDDVEIAFDEPMQMSDRAMLLAGDINRLIGAGKTGKEKTAADTGPATSTSSGIQSVLKRALALLGTPYRWGGTTTAGFDCSGLVGYVFRTTLGIELPRVSRDMARTGELVDRAAMSPGDLVFFGKHGRVSHVGIYLGEGRFVHAPRTGRDVTVSTLEGGYWGNKFLEARRVAGI